MSKRSSRKRRRVRARPLLVAAGAVAVMSGCYGGVHGVVARCPPGQPSSDCVTVPDQPDFSAEVPMDLGVVDLKHQSD